MVTTLNLPGDGETNWGGKYRTDITAVRNTADAGLALAGVKQNAIATTDTAPPSPVEGDLWFQTFTTAADTTPPTAATMATPTVDGSNNVSLSWSGATDASGVSYYQLWRGTGSGSTPTLFITRVDAATYIDATVTANTTYKYQVKAVDVFGNVGALSNTVTAVTGTAGLASDPDLRFLLYTDTALGGAATGSAVASLVPQYGSLVGALTLSQPTGGNQPTVSSTLLAGKKVVQHVAASLQYIGGTFPAAIVGATTMFLVANVTPAAATKIFVSGVPTTPYRGLGLNTSNKPTVNCGGSPANVAGPTTATAVWKVTAAVIDPVAGTGRLFDNKLTTPATGALATDTTVNAMGSIKVGRGAGSSATYTDLTWAALAVVERVMTDAEVGAVMTELGAAFGITVAA